VNPCVTAHSKELKSDFPKIVEKGNEEPASESGRYTTRNTKKPPAWSVRCNCFEDECTIFYLFVNEFIFAGESMGYGY